MKLVSQKEHPYPDTVIAIHLMLSCMFIATAFYVLYNFLSLSETGAVIYGAAVGVGFMVFSGFVYRPVSWLVKWMFEYIIKPILISYHVDGVSVIDMSKQAFRLRHNYGWKKTIFVDSRYSKDRKIVFYFIRGNCSEQFSINVDDLTEDGDDKVFGFTRKTTKYCDSCSQNVGNVYKVKPNTFFMEDITDPCNLCSDCLESIVKEELDNLDSDVYSDIVSRNM